MSDFEYLQQFGLAYGWESLSDAALDTAMPNASPACAPTVSQGGSDFNEPTQHGEVLNSNDFATVSLSEDDLSSQSPAPSTNFDNLLQPIWEFPRPPPGQAQQQLTLSCDLCNEPLRSPSEARYVRPHRLPLPLPRDPTLTAHPRRHHSRAIHPRQPVP